MSEELLLEFLKNKDFLGKLSKLDTPLEVIEEFKKIKIDVSFGQAEKIIGIINSENEFLSDDQLAKIAGGVNHMQKLSALGFTTLLILSTSFQSYDVGAYSSSNSTAYAYAGGNWKYKNNIPLGFLNKVTPLKLVNHDKRKTRIAVFKDTMNYCKKNANNLGIKLDKNGSFLNNKSYRVDYSHNNFKHSRAFKGMAVSNNAPNAKIWLTNGKSLQSLNAVNKKLNNKCRDSLVLNFGNYYNAGGGVTTGCTAQEEALCRMSTLYPHLSNAEMRSEFYTPHHKFGYPATLRGWIDSGIFNQAIYTKNVKQIKDDYTVGRVGEFVDGPIFDVMTVAAPDLRESLEPMRHKSYKHFIKEQWRMIFATAFVQKRKNLVLGALGCGAFKNDPKIISAAFYEVLNEKGPGGVTWRQCFKNIILPIYVSKHKTDRTNYKSFKDAHNAIYKHDNKFEELKLKDIE